jgi:hypothetical protein
MIGENSNYMPVRIEEVSEDGISTEECQEANTSVSFPPPLGLESFSYDCPQLMV